MILTHEVNYGPGEIRQKNEKTAKRT